MGTWNEALGLCQEERIPSLWKPNSLLAVRLARSRAVLGKEGKNAVSICRGQGEDELVVEFHEGEEMGQIRAGIADRERKRERVECDLPGNRAASSGYRIAKDGISLGVIDDAEAELVEVELPEKDLHDDCATVGIAVVAVHLFARDRKDKGTLGRVAMGSGQPEFGGSGRESIDIISVIGPSSSILARVSPGSWDPGVLQVTELGPVDPLTDALVDQVAQLRDGARRFLGVREVEPIDPSHPYSVDQVATRLQCPRSKVYALIQDGELTAASVAGWTRVLGADLTAYLRATRQPDARCRFR